MTVRIAAVVTPRIGFASHQNAVPVLRELEIVNDGDAALEDLTLTLASDPVFLASKSWRIDRLMPGAVLHITDRDVALDATLLSGLSESLAGSVTLTLKAADEQIARESFPVELLARSEWGGSVAMPELLAAFVMPNDPAVDRVLKAASDVLRRAGRPDAIDGYRAGSRERVWELASAIWSAVAGLQLSYALPSASFERQGQKVRDPGAILEGRLATCLDTALLFAAALEQASLNPLIVLTRGHALVGVWLQPLEFATLLIDEAAALRRRIDCKDMAVFETTFVTHSPPPSFSQAVAQGYRQLAEDASDPFEMALDLRRARMQKIRPLASSGGMPATPDNDAPPVSEALEAAPALPAFDVEVTELAAGTADRITLWQRKLLNLTTSNRLLSVPEGAKIVRLVCPEPGALEDRLASGKKIKIVSLPDLGAGGRDARLYQAQTNENLRDDYARQALAKGEVLSLIEPSKLDAVLVDLYRKARTDLEEGGANTLFLALGFLKWKKTASDTRVHRAPLLLLPVKLERKSALSGVVMTHHEDEPRFNLTLLELLRQDFELVIPELEQALPTDDSGIGLAAVWSIVRRAVVDIPGFEVTEELALGTFSFAKYLMWKDLVDRADQLKQSAIVRHLIEQDGDAFAARGAFPKASELDVRVDPADLFTPLPADSSQLAAVIASAEGHDFVLDGPPGTGKSQTIANMIAHNLALGRRVLFVAEKRAALEVVQRRLAEKGLGEFCLELHSNKTAKLDVIKQLDRAWSTRETLSAEQWAREAEQVRTLRDDLNRVVRLLHQPHTSGLSVHDAMGRVVRDAGEATPRFAWPNDAEHDRDALAAMRDIARRLGLGGSEVDDLPPELAAVARTDWSSGWQEEIVACARDLPPAIAALTRARDAFLDAAALPLRAEDGEAAGALVAFADTILATHGTDLRFAFSPDLSDTVTAGRDAIEHLVDYRAEEATLSAPYAAEAVRRIDLPGMQSAWDAACGKFWFLATLAKRRVARMLAAQGGVAGMPDPARDLPVLVQMRCHLDATDALAARVATVPGVAGIGSDTDRMAFAMDQAEALRRGMAGLAGSPDDLAGLRAATARLVVDANDLLGPDGSIAQARLRLAERLGAFENLARRFAALTGTENEGPLAFTVLAKRADTIVLHAARLRAWTGWRRVRDEAMVAGLGALVEGVESGTIAPADTIAAFDTGYARWFAIRGIDAEPLLREFVSSVHMDSIERFRALDDKLSALSVRYIRAKLCGLIPEKSTVGKKDGYGILLHQLQLQRRHKAVRQLAVEMGDAFTRLAPCMLMSPLSIAQYLPAGQALFDLVIFDEASQITPWDAIGSIARGRQVVIAGDPRQMPPTNFFERATNAADDGGATGADEDMESILDECLAAGIPSHSLEWHYRSRHESLIAFSNHRYYDSGLITFPAAVTRDSAVSWRKVDGIYARGKGRTNQREAEAMVTEAVARLTDPSFVDERGRGLSLAIITLNADQQKLVEDLLDKARREHPAIEPHFAEDRTEPVVVKNLETVQGDERDLILLGIGFGPTEPGAPTMSMAFGALNGQGGWRRLNVAITRARREMIVFTSFDPGLIDLNRTSARAVRDLKHFVEFADRGPRALAEAVQGSVGGFESPFEEAVAHALRLKGWTVVPQIGVSRFRIDLGIVHPDRPGDYLVGIECDGASYHSAATARDRDKVRHAILEGLGWRLLRLWSTDWWVDKTGATAKLDAAIRRLLEEDRTASLTPPLPAPDPRSDPPAPPARH